MRDLHPAVKNNKIFNIYDNMNKHQNKHTEIKMLELNKSTLQMLPVVQRSYILTNPSWAENIMSKMPLLQLTYQISELNNVVHRVFGCLPSWPRGWLAAMTQPLPSIIENTILCIKGPRGTKTKCKGQFLLDVHSFVTPVKLKSH